MQIDELFPISKHNNNNNKQQHAFTGVATVHYHVSGVIDLNAFENVYILKGGRQSQTCLYSLLCTEVPPISFLMTA